MELIRKEIKSYLPSEYQIKRASIVGLIRVCFLGLSFLLFYTIDGGIPTDIHISSEIAMVLTLTVSILIFLPIFERFSTYLKSKYLSEYLMEDASVSRFAYKRFDLNSLIKSVFPDMIKMSGSDSGSLGILKEDKTFDIYHYNRGRQKRINTRKENTPLNSLMLYLLNHKQGVSISDTIQNPAINQDFIDLRADFILPFLYRDKIFGFLATSGIPDRDFLQQLIVLSRQCALVIYNQNLSTHLVENMKYRNEEASAKRIQNLLNQTKIPKVPGFEFRIQAKDPSTLVEFFKTKDDRWAFLVLSLGGPIRSAGLVQSYILGLLFSRVRREAADSFVEIKSLIHETLQKANWKEKVAFLIGKCGENHRMEIFQEGTAIRVYEESNPSIMVTSIGWKNLVDLQSKIHIDLRTKNILQIEKR